MHKRNYYWTVSRADGDFFEYNRGGWRGRTNEVRCYSLSTALRHINKNLFLGHEMILEKWNRLSKRSPKRSPKGTYRVTSWTYKPNSLTALILADTHV